MRSYPRAWGDCTGSALIRQSPEDFQVDEVLGFEPSGDGEHALLLLQKRALNTQDLVRRLSALSGVARRDIGFCGMKDRNAVTRQWFSIGLAGKVEPDWRQLEADGSVKLLRAAHHRRKLRRGVHRGNRFRLRLRQMHADREKLESRLCMLRQCGAPNYFGEQRFGRGGATLQGAQRWLEGEARPPRDRRSLYLSALRSLLFNELLAARVASDDWCKVSPGEICILNHSNSFFTAKADDTDIDGRLEQGDLHPGLPLWGNGSEPGAEDFLHRCRQQLSGQARVCSFLEQQGLKLAWRSTRLMPDDFFWQFCDDDSLQLEFTLEAGGFATALLAELLEYGDGSVVGGGSEQG